MKKYHAITRKVGLAEKFGIPMDINKQFEFLDEEYEKFCNEYIELSNKRDENVKKYLIEKPNLFRTFIPWNYNTFDTVFQLQWYYDELIIYDPIIFEIVYLQTQNLEENKSRLRNLISFLYTFKDSITEGFLLFASYHSFGSDDENERILLDNLTDIIDLPDIQKELDNQVYVAKMQKSKGTKLTDFTIKVYYRGHHKFIPIVQTPNNPKPDVNGMYTWTIDLIGSHYIPMTVEEVKSVGAYDKVFNDLKKYYPLELKSILEDLIVGSSIMSPVLFSRKLEELVVLNINKFENLQTESKAGNFYNLTLPFVEGIPPDRLLELRFNIPTAFTDFRNTLSDIIFDLQKENFDSDILKLKLQQKVNPILKMIETEMKNSLIKTKIMGLGLPIVGGAGAFGLWQAGIDISKIAGFLLGGLSLSSELKVFLNHQITKNTIGSNPFYYLWKVKK